MKKLTYDFMYNEPITPENVLKFGDTLYAHKIVTFHYDMTTAWAYASGYEESYSPWFAYCSKDNCFYEPNGYNWNEKRWNFVKVEGLTTIQDASEYFTIGESIISCTCEKSTDFADEMIELREAHHNIKMRLELEKHKKQEQN